MSLSNLSIAGGRQTTRGASTLSARGGLSPTPLPVTFSVEGGLSPTPAPVTFSLMGGLSPTPLPVTFSLVGGLSPWRVEGLAVLSQAGGMRLAAWSPYVPISLLSTGCYSWGPWAPPTVAMALAFDVHGGAWIESDQGEQALETYEAAGIGDLDAALGAMWAGSAAPLDLCLYGAVDDALGREYSTGTYLET